MHLLISGASQGIGRASVWAAAEAGHTVYALARNEDELQRMKASVSGVIPIPLDLTDAHLEDRLNAILEQEGVQKLDGVINAAGFLEVKAFLDQSQLDWQRTLEVNLIGPARMLRVLHPYLEKASDPHVVLIGSMAGYPGSSKFPGLSAYGASKSALGGLGESLAEEWKGAGIRVNTLALGAVDTDMFKEAFPDGEAPVTPERMASFILSFLMEGGKVMNGKHLPVSLSTP